uniref:Major allergen I polypeptide chain 1-like n=1 Tax=Bos indicus x Bos taurus TaxID=30522 RepID=A0A4W2EJM3_BOBOX
MTRAGALLLLCTALLFIMECDDICPASRDTVDLFISGSHEAYIEQVEKYNQNSDVLETADTLKSCVDEKLTAEDKQDASLHRPFLCVQCSFMSLGTLKPHQVYASSLTE